MKILVVNICGALNSGDHTQLVSLLKVIRETYPQSDVTCVHRNPELHSQILPQVRWVETLGTAHSMSKVFRRLGNLRGLLPAFLRIPSLLPKAQAETFTALREADLVVACAGGYLGDPGPHVYTALLHMTLSRNGRMFVFPQSIGPMHSRLAKHLATRVLKRSPVLCVREPRTYDYVTQEMGFTKESVRLFPDMAFYERDVDESGARDVLRSLGLSVEEPIAATTLWPSSRLNVPEDRYFGILAGAAKTLLKNHGIRTVVLRQAGDAEGIEGDEYLLRQAAPYFGDAAVMAHDYHPPAVLRGIVRTCQVTYGTRMHGNVFSLAQCVPTVAISYNHKTDGIMEMCGQGRYVISLRKLELSSLNQLLQEALQEQCSIRASLESVNSKFQERRAELIQLLRRHGH